MNKKIIIGAALFITIATGVSKFHGNIFPVISGNDRNSANVSSANIPPVGRKNSITVSNQEAGNSVEISSVELEKKGFVAINEKDGDSFGKIIGSSGLLESGVSSNVHITLREPTQDGKKYFAVLVVDNGDGRYLPGTDHPVMNTAGDGGALKAEFSVGVEKGGTKNN